MGRPALVERLDQRLHDRGRAVEGAGVAPRFQVVGLGQMPVALPRRFVLVEAQMDAQRHLLHVLGEAQVGRRGEDRIAAEDHQHLDLARGPCRRPVRAAKRV